MEGELHGAVRNNDLGMLSAILARPDVSGELPAVASWSSFQEAPLHVVAYYGQ